MTGESERNRTITLSLEDIRGVTHSAMQQASRTIFELGSTDSNLAGMSTTASVMLAVGEFAVIGHVGDTRVYHSRGDSTRQVTEKHTSINMRISQGLCGLDGKRRRQSPIIRALGPRDVVEVDILTAPLVAGDRLLLCTDGAHESRELDAVLKQLFRMDPQDAALAALRHVSHCGGKDDATAVVSK